MIERYCAHGQEERVCPLCSLDWNEMRLRAETAEAQLSALAFLGPDPVAGAKALAAERDALKVIVDQVNAGLDASFREKDDSATSKLSAVTRERDGNARLFGATLDELALVSKALGSPPDLLAAATRAREIEKAARSFLASCSGYDRMGDEGKALDAALGGGA